MQFVESVSGNPEPGGAYSHGVILPEAGLLHFAGHVGLDVEGGRPEAIADEVALAIDNLERTLQAAGCSLRDVAQVTCLLSDVAHFGVFDSVFRTRFHRPWPARATFGVALAGGLRFEIFGVAQAVPDAVGIAQGENEGAAS